MLKEKKIKCRNSRITAWADSETALPNMPPWLVYVSVTNICNSKCFVCGHGKAMREDQGVMKLETFKKIVASLPDEVKKVYLFKQGEPFVNVNIELFAEYLREKRPEMHISLHTNGIIAKKERIARLLPLVNSLGISISAISKETYAKVHGVDKFDDVIENIQGISDLLAGMEKPPHVFIDYISQERNSNEKKEDVIQFFKKSFPNLSSIDFHWVYNFQGETEEGNLKIYDELDEDLFPCCVFPWSAITFCYDGKVSYCFVEPREKTFLGDISTQSFNEIWNGKLYVEFRRMMVEKQFNEMWRKGYYCAKCSWLWSMRSQAPKNLNGGYTLPENKMKDMGFEDMLEARPEQMCERMADYYLNGQTAKALVLSEFLLSSGIDGDSKVFAEFVKEKSGKILSKYKNLSLWRQKLEEEGAGMEARKCEYFRVKE